VLGNLGAESLEVVGVGNKVGLAVDFHDHAHRRIVGHIAGDHTFGGNTAGLLGGGGKALFTQPFNGLFHFALGFHQGLFAVHHSGLGHFAQFLHHLSGDIRHRDLSFLFIMH
jgi:hypothetical protein